MQTVANTSPRRPEHGGGHVRPAWIASLSDYQTPTVWKSSWQLAHTLLLYGAGLFLMIRSMQLGAPYALTLLLGIFAAGLLVRVFILFHDCVHGSLFRVKDLNTVFGHLLGVLVFTPFEDWRYSHLRHHVSYANLDARGFGDIWTMTRKEYETAPGRKQLAYRLYRHPLVLFGLGALFNFLLRFRFPIRVVQRKERMSVLLTNLLIAGVVLLAVRSVGWRTYVLVQLPVIWMAGATGVWLFYVQHQFTDVYWSRKKDWYPLRAAMEGSSFYKLPEALRWLTANIGYHHVHHLNSRIPNYRLKPCYDAIPALQAKPPLTIRQSLAGIRLKMWDEESKKLVGFRPAERTLV